MFGKALSAFSNSAGGVLVYGVEARKRNGVDCAQAIKPISGIAVFRSEALALIGQLLQPKHDGILCEAIPSTGGDGEAGYLILRVPRSERRPHRCEAKGQKQYFKRSGDSSFPMEHYDIEDAFRRISLPEISLSFTYGDGGATGSQQTCVFQHISIVFSIINIGSLSARNAYVAASHLLSHDSDYVNIPIARFSDGYTYFELHTEVINPGTSRMMAPVTKKIRCEKGKIKRENFRIQEVIWYGCLDMPARKFVLDLDSSKLEKFVHPMIGIVD